MKRITVAHLRQISPKDVWGSVWERKHTFKHFKELGIEVKYFYDDNIITPEESKIYDILNIGEFSFGTWQEQFIKEHKKPIIMVQETSYQSLINGSRDIDINLIKSKPYFIALTNWARDLLIHFGINGNKISTIPCAADLDTFKPCKIDTDFKKPVFLYVGSFNKKKGVHNALKSFAEIGIGTLLMIEGEFNNDDSKLIRELINDLSINDKVYIKPFPPLEELPKYYHMSDIVIYPQSYEEGEPIQFGHPLLWGLSCGLPLISLNMGGAKDMIINGINGYLCDSYDDMVYNMRYIAENESIIKKFGESSYNIANRKFHPYYIGKLYKKFYTRVLNAD